MKNNIRAMIADDEELFREYLKTVVDWNAQGFEIICETQNGLQALERAREEHPDVMFVDIDMPHMDGLSLIDTLQKEKMDTLCVLVTGYGDFEYAQRAIKLRVFDYLLKPFTQDELLLCLAQLRGHIEDGLRVENTASRPDAALEQLQYLRQLLGEEEGGAGGESGTDIYGSFGWSMPACLRLVQGELPEKTTWAYLLVLRAIKFLYEHYGEDLSISMIAKELFVSQSYLRKVFANELRVSVTQALLDIRMDRALRMLAGGSHSVAHVAERTGYSDPAYFTRVFRKNFGLTPSAFEVTWYKKRL